MLLVHAIGEKKMLHEVVGVMMTDMEGMEGGTTGMMTERTVIGTTEIQENPIKEKKRTEVEVGGEM